MSTERKPLLSDEDLSAWTPITADWPDGPHLPVSATEVRVIYESARAKDAELIQRFVDHNAKWAGHGCIEADMEWDAIVSDCIAAGFTPSEE